MRIRIYDLGVSVWLIVLVFSDTYLSASNATHVREPGLTQVTDIDKLDTS